MQIIQLDESDMYGTKPNIEPIQNIYIAGGSIRQWFNGNEKLNDIDIFAASEQDLKLFKEQKLQDYKIVNETNNAISFLKNKQVVQLIKIKYFSSLEILFDSFDYTICQFALTCNGIFATDKAILSTLRNHLAVHNINKDFAIDSLRRAFKYNERGYKPCWGTLRDLASSFRNITEQQINNQIEISPKGNKRVIRYD